MRKGSKHSEKTKELISKDHKGKNYSLKTEFKKGDIPHNKGVKGVVNFSEETKKRMSEAKKGHTISQETRRKISEAQKGKTITLEQRKNMSNAHKGKAMGKDNPMWKENKKPESVRRYYNRKAREKLIDLGKEVQGKDVHHKDGNFKNNNLTNLQIISTIDHTKLHWEHGKKREVI